MFTHINRVAKAYIFWDLTVNSAWGLLSPVFAIFIVQNITVGGIGDAARVAGFATLCYWITKAVLQMPIAAYLDKNHGEKDDFWFFVMGTTIVGLVPLGYLFAHQPWHVYVLQIVQAAGWSMIIPSAAAIFIRHIDEGRESFTTGLDNTLSGAGIGITGAIGGLIVSYVGFKLIFIMVSIFTLLAIPIIFSIKKNMRPKMSQKIHKFPPQKIF